MNWFQQFEQDCVQNFKEGKPPLFGVEDEFQTSLTLVDFEDGKLGAKLLGFSRVPGQTNVGNRNIYVTLLNEEMTAWSSTAADRPSFLLRARGHQDFLIPMDKGFNPNNYEPQGNGSLGANLVYDMWMKGEAPNNDFDQTDMVNHFLTAISDKEPGSTWGHHSFYAVFKIHSTGGGPGPTPPGPTPPNPPNPGPIIDKIEEIQNIVKNPGFVIYTQQQIIELNQGLEELKDLFRNPQTLNLTGRDQE